MGRDTGRLREEIRERLLNAGALAVGFAEAGAVSAEADGIFDDWLEKGRHAGMDYMLHYRGIRSDARLLLEGARSVISMAFGYKIKERRDPSLPYIASYALLPDYHEWIRKLIRRSGAGELLGEEGRDWRICVDSAPVMERYWAFRSGVAFRGRNGAAIVPGGGAEVFLAEIVTVTEFMPDPPLEISCGDCGICLKSCPTGALRLDGTIECNRCLSYLTIEHKGDWTDPVHLEAVSTPEGRNTLFGCDRCVANCPHNSKEATSAVDPLPGMPEFDSMVPLPHSSLKRAGTDALKRNLSCRRGRCC